MPQPEFLSFGTTPHRQDTQWTEAVRWLGSLQNRSGALPGNDPRRTDSYHRILEKIAGAVSGTSGGTDIAACVSPGPTNLTIVGGGNAADWAWSLATDPEQDFLLEYGTVSGGPYTDSEAVSASIRSYGTLHASDGVYYGVVTARDSDSCVSDPSNEVQFTII